MAKVNTYLRIGKGKKGYKVVASSKPNYEPITTGSAGYNQTYLPTVSFGITLNIPDEMFKQAEEIVAQVDLIKKEIKINNEIGVIVKP